MGPDGLFHSVRNCFRERDSFNIPSDTYAVFRRRLSATLETVVTNSNWFLLLLRIGRKLYCCLRKDLCFFTFLGAEILTKVLKFSHVHILVVPVQATYCAIILLI